MNIDNLVGEPEQLLFAIGRDVHDPSWLWTVDYTNLKHVDICTGFNAHEAALVLHYNDVPLGLVTDDLEVTMTGPAEPVYEGHMSEHLTDRVVSA